MIFFIIFKFTKSAGLILFKVFLGLIITLLIFITLQDKTKSVILKLLFLILPLSVINYGFSTRPQIFTYLFFTIFIFVIDKFETTENTRWLYGLPFISLAWCNLHGGFVTGIGILLIYLFFKIIQLKLKSELIIITILSMAATFINPNGKELWVFLLKSLFINRPYIFEWQRIRLSFLYLGYFGLLSLAIIGLLFSRLKKPIYEVVFLFIGFLFSLRHNRHIVLFAILFAMYIPKYIDSFTANGFIGLEKRFTQKFFIFIISSLSLYFFLAAPYRCNGNPFKIKIPEEIYPIEAITFMKDNGISGNTFVFFNWAEMYIRELSGKNKVFFDGRYETVYSDNFIEDYFEILYCKRDYKDYLALYPQTDIMFLHRLNPLTFLLIKDKDWILIYSSSLAWIFLKDNKKNSHIIENFKNNRLIYNREKPSFTFR